MQWYCSVAEVSVVLFGLIVSLSTVLHILCTPNVCNGQRCFLSLCALCTQFARSGRQLALVFSLWLAVYLVISLVVFLLVEEPSKISAH